MMSKKRPSARDLSLAEPASVYARAPKEIIQVAEQGILVPFGELVDLVQSSEEPAVSRQTVAPGSFQPEDLIGGGFEHFREADDEGAMQSNHPAFIVRNERLIDPELLGDLDLS